MYDTNPFLNCGYYVSLKRDWCEISYEDIFLFVCFADVKSGSVGNISDLLQSEKRAAGWHFAFLC